MGVAGTVLKAVKEETYNEWKMGGEPYPVMSRKEEYEHCRAKYPQIPKTMLLKDHAVNIGTARYHLIVDLQTWQLLDL